MLYLQQPSTKLCFIARIQVVPLHPQTAVVDLPQLHPNDLCPVCQAGLLLLALLHLVHHLQPLQVDLLQDHHQVDHLLAHLPGSQEDLPEAHPQLCHVAKIL